MPVVIDASLAANWYFPDEFHPEADRALDLLGEVGGRTPIHWWFEFRNILIVNERRSRITIEQTEEALEFIRHLPIVIVALPDERDVFILARRHRLTFYDAAYLELAKREGIALGTLDDALARAAIAEKVDLIISPD